MQEEKGESGIVGENSENEQLGKDSGLLDYFEDPNSPKRAKLESGKKVNKKENKKYTEEAKMKQKEKTKIEL